MNEKMVSCVINAVKRGGSNFIYPRLVDALSCGLDEEASKKLSRVIICHRVKKFISYEPQLIIITLKWKIDTNSSFIETGNFINWMLYSYDCWFLCMNQDSSHCIVWIPNELKFFLVSQYLMFNVHCCVLSFFLKNWFCILSTSFYSNQLIRFWSSMPLKKRFDHLLSFLRFWKFFVRDIRK